MGTAILASINSTCPIVFKLSTIFGAGLARPNWISLRQGNLSALLDGTVRWECSFDKDLTTFRPQFRLEGPPLSRFVDGTDLEHLKDTIYFENCLYVHLVFMQSPIFAIVTAMGHPSLH